MLFVYSLVELTPRRRPRRAEISGDGQVPGALDEFA
jgi:hypothetical protein